MIRQMARGKRWIGTNCILNRMGDVLGVIMRWLHISSVVTLIGGMLYASLALRGVDGAEPFAEKAAARFRPLVWASVVALILSGAYNVASMPGHSPRYLVLLGIKLLLVMHVFASALLAVRPHNPRRARQMTGGFLSGLLIILISAYLRRIF